MSPLVVDASVVVKGFLPESNGVAALRVAASDWTFLAPDLLGVEVTDTFWKKHRRGELTDDEAARLIDDLRRLDIGMASHRPLLPKTFALAAVPGHPVHDCLYLALADQNDCQLVTADRRFYRAFTKGGWRHRLLWTEDR